MPLPCPKNETGCAYSRPPGDDLDKLVAYLTPNRWIRDYVRLSYPVSVETLSVKKWQSYCRYRIPTDKSDRKTGEEKGFFARDE